MNPLYCFRLHKDTGEIEKREITEYSKRMWDNRREYFKYQRKGNIYFAYREDFDRYKNDRVYSFDDDAEKAKEIILRALEVKCVKAQNDLSFYSGIIERIKGWGKENENIVNTVGVGDLV